VAGDHQASVDREICDELRALENPRRPDFFAKLVARYVTTSRALIDEIGWALNDGELDRVRIAAHRLKGSSRQFGAFELSARCEQVIQAGERGDSGEVDVALQSVDAEHRQVVSVLIEG